MNSRTSLFDPNNETYTEEAKQIDNEINSALRPILKKWLEKNVSIRDLEYITKAAVEGICLEKILLRASKS